MTQLPTAIDERELPFATSCNGHPRECPTRRRRAAPPSQQSGHHGGVTWHAAVATVAVLAVSLMLAFLLAGLARNRGYEVPRRPLRASLRPRLITCALLAFASAIGWQLAISPPPWWSVPAGVLVGMGGLSSLTFTVFGLLFDADHVQRR